MTMLVARQDEQHVELSGFEVQTSLTDPRLPLARIYAQFAHDDAVGNHVAARCYIVRRARGQLLQRAAIGAERQHRFTEES